MVPISHLQAGACEVRITTIFATFCYFWMFLAISRSAQPYLSANPPLFCLKQSLSFWASPYFSSTSPLDSIVALYNL